MVSFNEPTSEQYAQVARDLVNAMRRTLPLHHPPAALAFFEWRDGTYFGSVQVPYPEYSTEIVSVSKTSDPLAKGLAAAVREAAPSLPTLQTNAEIDFAGRQHILRRLEDRLVKMTPKQTQYVLDHPIIITER